MKFFCLTVISLISAAAGARSNTEYYFQPAGGRSLAEVQFETVSNPAKITVVGGTGGESNFGTTTNDINLRYAYGLSDGNAIGVFTGFGSLKYSIATTDRNASGLRDVNLFYKGFSDIWHYGAILGVSTSKTKIENGFPKNRSSGGLSVGANLGAMWSSGAMNYGADLSYLHPFERSYDDGTKLTSGSVLKFAPFYEYNYGMGFVGAELSYNVVRDMAAKQPGQADVEVKGQNYAALKLFGSYDFNESWTGLLNLSAGMHNDHDYNDKGNAEKAYVETGINVAIRCNF